VRLFCRGRGDGNRLGRDGGRSASVLQRAPRRSRRRGGFGRRRRRRQRLRPVPFRVLQADVAAGRTDAVAGLRQGHGPVRVPRHRARRLRRVVRQAVATVRDGPVEVRQRRVRRSGLRRVRRGRENRYIRVHALYNEFSRRHV